MRPISRRDFLRIMAAGAGGLAAGGFLAGCTDRTPASVSGQVPPKASEATSTSGAAEAAGATAEPAPATAGPLPDLAVARGGEPGDLVRRALRALGGIERFVPSGSNVIIKPNICVAYHTYEYAATTNPWVVAALVELCRQAGAARVRVMDNPFGGTAEAAYARSGIAEQVLAAGGEMEVMSRIKFLSTSLPNARSLREAQIYEDVLTADVLINVPIAKDHGLARLTLGMKNLMGVIYDRPTIHADIGLRLADLADLIRPELTVIDAVRILTANGPTGGNLDDVRRIDTLIASPDIVAADSFAAGLFGMQPEDLVYVAAGAAMGVGRSDLSCLRIEEV